MIQPDQPRPTAADDRPPPTAHGELTDRIAALNGDARHAHDMAARALEDHDRWQARAEQAERLAAEYQTILDLVDAPHEVAP